MLQLTGPSVCYYSSLFGLSGPPMGKKVGAGERAHSDDNSKDLVPRVGTSLPVLHTAWGATMTSFS